MSSQALFDVSGSDPFAAYYTTWMNRMFTGLRSSSCSDLWPLLVEYYKLKSADFQILGGLHQNNEEDGLHFSIHIGLPYNSYRIHVYGYWRNGFIITYATYIVNKSRVWSDPQVLVDFRRLAEEDLGSVGSG